MFGLTTLFGIIQKMIAGEQELPLYVSDCWFNLDDDPIEIIVWNEEP